VGLEVVEFVLDLEKALGFSINDRDVNGMTTPRELVTYLCTRLPEVDPGFGTNSGRWTRAGIEQVVEGLLAKNSGRSDISLDTDFRDIFP
jgi:hypothetical protein